MGIDPRLVKWDDQPSQKTIDPSLVNWNASANPSEVPQRDISDKLIQGAANLFSGGLRGAGSIGSTLMLPVDMVKQKMRGEDFFSMKDNLERRKAIDEGLQEFGVDPNSKMYRVGKLSGEIAGTAGAGGVIANTARAVVPASLAARAAPVLSAIESGGMTAGTAGIPTRMLGGAVNGAVSSAMVNPQDTMMGAGVGAALPPVLKVFGAGGNALRNLLTAGGANKDLAQTAINKYGIPLGMADATSSPVIKATRSILNDAPVIGGVGAKQKEAVQEAFNQAVGNTFGANAKKLTSEVLDDAKQRMGSEFDRIWNRNVLQVDAPFMQKLMSMEQQAAKLPKNEGASLRSEINDLYSKITTDAAGNPVIAGDVANRFQSYLRRRAESSSGLKNELSDLRQNIISSFNRGVSQADAAALTLNRSQYKAYKTVEPLLNKGEVGVAGREAGDIPAALLPNAVASSYTNAAGTPLAELSRIGSKFLVDRVARTGGSTRAALQNGAIGGAIGAGSITNPAFLAAFPAAYGVNSLLGNPELAKRLINSNMGLLGTVNPELLQFGYQAAPVAITGSR